ncbi:thiamine phosphate synthase [Nocardioides pacificus]
MTPLAAARLVLLTDRSRLHLGRGLLRTVRECADAGLTHVIVREHDLPAGARVALVAQLAAVDGLSVLSSRIVDPSAAGLHLAAAQSVPAGWDGRWGRSCHSVEEVRRAAAQGAAWATLSPYAATASKPGYGPALDASAFSASRSAGVPVWALGGITPDNAGAALAARAHGVAVMGAVMGAADPAAVVRALLAATTAEVGHRTDGCEVAR